MRVSRGLWENCVGRSRAFWRFFYPILQATFHHQLRGVDMDQFYAVINRVKPSLIRVEADELTYNLHIMLRFEIEQDLIEGKTNPEELPAHLEPQDEGISGDRSVTTEKACCRMSIGRWAASATSRPIP